MQMRYGGALVNDKNNDILTTQISSSGLVFFFAFFKANVIFIEMDFYIFRKY